MLVLDDISRAQKLDDRMKEEILQDDEAKNVSAILWLIASRIQVIKFVPRCSVSSTLRVSPPPQRCPTIPDPLPGALRELIDVAESTRSALAERDIVAARYREQQQGSEYENPEGNASASGTYHNDTPHDSDGS